MMWPVTYDNIELGIYVGLKAYLRGNDVELC